MRSDRKIIGILIILLGVLIILTILYFGFWRQNTPVVDDNTSQATTTTQLPSGKTIITTTPGDVPRNQQSYDISSEPVHEFNVNDLEKMAMAFSERLGSYSSQSDYSNFSDLKIYMTESLKNWVTQYSAELRDAREGTSYYGISTTAIYVKVKSFDDVGGRAAVTVTTERRESTETINGGDPFRQNIDLSFEKINGEWLVSKAYWSTK